MREKVKNIAIDIVVASGVVALAGCATSPPIAIVLDDAILRGEGVSAEQRFRFSVKDEKNPTLSCDGTFPNNIFSVKFSFPLSCSDGRQGEVFATRLPGEILGRVRLADGGGGVFLLSADARRVNSKSLLLSRIAVEEGRKTSK